MQNQTVIYADSSTPHQEIIGASGIAEESEELYVINAAKSASTTKSGTVSMIQQEDYE